MTSKEKLNFILTTVIFPECISKEEMREVFKAMDAVEKDLEELEELKKIMGTPIQDIMKKLRKLEVIEKHFAYGECGFILIKPISIEDDEILKEV